MHFVGSRWFAFVAFAAVSACGGSPATTSGTTSGVAPSATASTTSGGTNTPVATNAPHETAIGEEPPEFPSTDANRWVNGTPTTLASLRGNVVLVESWHRL